MPDAAQQVDLRDAHVADVPGMASVLNDYAERGLMLHRSRSELYDRIRDFRVAEHEGRIVGVAGLRVMWANLAEVYALAVAPSARGMGLGRKLVESMVELCREIGVRRAFALTYEREFFERCGFEVVDRRTLPLKVWGECVRCPKHEACDEIAMVRELPDVADGGAPVALSGGEEAYEVPMPRLTPATLRIDRSAGD
jgi:amino-acid N-acetyltransferase